MHTRRFILASAVILAASTVFSAPKPPAKPSPDVTNWKGTAFPSNAPIQLGDDGGADQANTVTASLSADAAATGLTVTNSKSQHTLDLDGKTLTIQGNLNFWTHINGSGSLTLRNGSLISADRFGDCNIAYAPSGDAAANLDFSGLDLLDISAKTLRIAVGQKTTSSATVQLAAKSTFKATDILIADTLERGNAQIHLGKFTTLLADTLTIADTLGQAEITLPPAGTLTLGAADKPLALTLGRVTNSGTGHGFKAILNCAAGRLDATLADLTVANGQASLDTCSNGSLIGGTGGTITLGSKTRPASFRVGVGNNGNANGIVDLSNMDSLTATLSDFTIGAGEKNNTTQGDVKLPNTVNLSARTITVGAHSERESSLNLGKNVTLLADEILVGAYSATAKISLVPRGSLKLGTAANPVTLRLAIQEVPNTGHDLQSEINLSESRLEGFLSDVTIGESLGGNTTSTGRFVGARGGELHIGSHEKPAVIRLGRGDSGNGVAFFDVSGLDTLTVDASDFNIAVSERGSGSATVTLAKNSTINATALRIGERTINGNQATLHLGESTVLNVPEILIGGNGAFATVDLPAGAKITIGSPEKRARITLARNNYINTGVTYVTTVDLRAGVSTIYASTLTVSEFTGTGAHTDATLSLGESDGSLLDADAIVLGAAGRGTLKLPAGKLLTKSLTAGSNEGTLDWRGGTLIASEIGSPTQSFPLNNTGKGTLSPAGDAIGKTTLYGDYTQAETAHLHIDIASPTSADLLEIKGKLALSGTVDVALAKSYTPKAGDAIPIATATDITLSATPTFTSPLPDTLTAWLEENDGKVTLVFAPKGTTPPKHPPKTPPQPQPKTPLEIHPRPARPPIPPKAQPLPAPVNPDATAPDRHPGE